MRRNAFQQTSMELKLLRSHFLQNTMQDLAVAQSYLGSSRCIYGIYVVAGIRITLCDYQVLNYVLKEVTYQEF
jgi:hypothetical protein